MDPWISIIFMCVMIHYYHQLCSFSCPRLNQWEPLEICSFVFFDLFYHILRLENLHPGYLLSALHLPGDWGLRNMDHF